MTDLRVAYPGGRLALDGLTLDVPPGATLGLLGPNGSGKSTLFRVLCALLPPTSGTVAVCGLAPADARASVAAVFQAPALDRELTAAENLDYHARLLGLQRRERRERVARLLDRVGLGDRGRDPAKRLSGGLRRRLDVARALLAPRPVLLLDEPTVGLDPAARREAWRLVADLRREAAIDLGRPVTVLLTTHLLDDLDAAGCDRVLLLDQGRVVADDAPDALRDLAGGGVVTLEPDGDPEPVAAALRDRLGLPATTADGLVRIEVDDAAAALPRVLSAGLPVRRATGGRATLEDAYLKLTGRSLSG